MDELLGKVKAWFRGLAQREQYAVLAGAGVSVAVILFAAWMPIERRVSHLEDSVRTKQADLAWLQSVAPQLGALRNAAANSRRTVPGRGRGRCGPRDRHRPLIGREPAR